VCSGRAEPLCRVFRLGTTVAKCCALVCATLIYGAWAIAAAEHETSLQDLVQRGDFDALKTAIGRGAAVNKTDARGERPLFVAVESGATYATKLLLEAGANPNVVNRHGLTPLGMASLRGYTLITRELLLAGARTDAPDSAASPMYHAVVMGRPDIVRLLAVYKADVNQRDPAGTPLLSVAARHRDPDTALALLEHGADPNLSDLQGHSPLFWALSMHDRDMTVLLLRNGARPGVMAVDIFDEPVDLETLPLKATAESERP
jgi:uncharacterized protein